ncbi:MAG: SixA phosphatase family protein, partial [Steroidobacteraceae bacterium]
IKRVAPRPVRVLVSPVLRARQTAAILTEFGGWPRAAECAALAPGSSPEALFAALRRLPDPCIAVVGHEPGLGRVLAASLCGTGRAPAFGLKKMGAARLSFQGGACAGEARLAWLVPPGMLRAARY